ncbi:MATE family efflux transporter [Anaerovibrio sp.]|uniref:MATE family efflux transporter n=1 Tax=Anaerovibrio sp. TaxID=1872532 RepID=UPI003F13AFC9
MAKLEINMLEGSIWDKVLKFAVPLAMTSIMQQLFNAADVAIVGQFVGKEALAAVGANGIVINLMLNLMVGLSIGANVVCANFLGAGNYLRLTKAVHTSMLIAFLCGIFLAVFGVSFGREILILIDTPPEILDAAELYLQILMGGVPTLLLYNFGSALLRSKGDTRRPLYAMLASGCINVSMNLFFVLALQMGVEGVAIATVIATTCSACLILYWLHGEEGPMRLQPGRLAIDGNVLKHIAKIGLPAGLQGMVFSFSNIIIQIAINNLGAEYIAASAIALNFEFAAFFILSSFSQAATTFVGQNFGAKNIPRCRQIMRWCVGMNFFITGIICLLISIFAPYFAAIYTTDASVIEYAVLRIRYILTFECLNVIIETCSGGMRGVGHSLYPAVACFLGVCVFRVIYIYTIFAAEPVFHVLMAVYPISWVFTIFLIIGAYFHVFNKLERAMPPALGK